jgi:hypothetical protein
MTYYPNRRFASLPVNFLGQIERAFPGVGVSVTCVLTVTLKVRPLCKGEGGAERKRLI